MVRSRLAGSTAPLQTEALFAKSKLPLASLPRTWAWRSVAAMPPALVKAKASELLMVKLSLAAMALVKVKASELPMVKLSLSARAKQFRSAAEMPRAMRSRPVKVPASLSFFVSEFSESAWALAWRRFF
jgi:hypothetical protein